jgi:rod shape-determining protein MreD
MKAQRYFQSALIVFGLFLVQTLFVPFISIAGYVPDILLIWLATTALRRGQVEATVSGFAVGLLQDIVTTKFFGLAALSKTVAGFVLGYFFNDNTTEQTLGSYRYILLVLLSSVIHNAIYFLILFQGTEGSTIFAMFEMNLGLTLYTVVISVLPMFVFSQKYDVSWSL